VWELPQAGRASKGRPIVNLLEKMDEGEKIEACVAVSAFNDNQYLLFVTQNGQVQKNSLSLYSNPMKKGIKAFNVSDGDRIVNVKLCDDQQDLLIATRKGMAIRFKVGDVRAAGRFTQGVRGISLEDGDYVIGMESLRPNSTILTVSEKGMGKRSAIEDYRVIGRGGKGVINMKLTDKTGEIVGINEVLDNDEMIMITAQGQTIRFRVADLRVIGRNTQGVRLFNLADGDRIVAVSRQAEEDEKEGASPDLLPPTDGASADGASADGASADGSDE